MNYLTGQWNLSCFKGTAPKITVWGLFWPKEYFWQLSLSLVLPGKISQQFCLYSQWIYQPHQMFIAAMPAGFENTSGFKFFHTFLQMKSDLTSGKEHTHQCRRHKRHGFDPWVGKISWRRAWQPTPVFLPGESHRQRSLAGYSPWGHRAGHDWRDLAHMQHTAWFFFQKEKYRPWLWSWTWGQC